MFSRIPKVIKEPVKAMIRQAVRLRFDHRQLSLDDADRWAVRLKRWPAIFGPLDYRTRCCLPGDIVMDLGLTDVVERNLLTCGSWDPVVRAVLEAYLRPGSVLLDVGANIGYFTLLGSKIVGDTGVVIACEPSTRALRKLTHHLELNICANVLVVSAAAGEHPGIQNLQLATESNIGGTSILRGSSYRGRTEKVWVTRLDDIVLSLGLCPSLIKIDVEGYELNALRGASGILEQFHPPVVSELTERFLASYGGGVRELLSYMQGHGYRCFILKPFKGKYGCRLLENKIGNLPREQVDVLFTSDEPRLPFV